MSGTPPGAEPPPSGPGPDKARLRILGRDRIRALDEARRQAAGAAIAERIWKVPEVRDAATILLFASLPEEVPTAPLAGAILGHGRRLVYPRSRPGGRLHLHEVRDIGELRPGRYGILEPAESLAAVAHAEVHLALTPGLAWDRRGTRLGRGGGYFDRLFGGDEWEGFVCGIFFAVQEVEHIPRDPWDVPLGAVVTEREVWRPGVRGPG